MLCVEAHLTYDDRLRSTFALVPLALKGKHDVGNCQIKTQRTRLIFHDNIETTGVYYCEYKFKIMTDDRGLMLD